MSAAAGSPCCAAVQAAHRELAVEHLEGLAPKRVRLLERVTRGVEVAGERHGLRKVGQAPDEVHGGWVA